MKTEARSFKELCREQIVVRLPFELRRRLEREAREKNLTISKLVRLYLEQNLEKGLVEEG
jgi:predicted DNA-binding protein